VNNSTVVIKRKCHCHVYKEGSFQELDFILSVYPAFLDIYFFGLNIHATIIYVIRNQRIVFPV